MTNETIHDQALVTSAASDDEVGLWVVASGILKRITCLNFMGGLLTGLGTIITNSFTLTIPATGTAALRGVANTFTALNTFTQIGVGTTSPEATLQSGGSMASNGPLGLVVTKTNVASGTATALVRIDGVGGFQSGSYLVTIETYGGSTLSIGTWIVTHASATEAATLLAQSIYGHSALALTVVHNTGNYQTTLTFTQTNGGAVANIVRCTVQPLAAYVGQSIILTAL